MARVKTKRKMVIKNEGKLNREKYLNAVLYLIKYCNNDFLGLTKLNKLLYYLDFISYRDRKNSVTNDVYIHKDYGPVPDSVDDILADLKAQEKISVEEMPYKDKVKFIYKTLKNPNMDAFDAYEKELLEKICKEFNLYSTDQIVSQTHLEAPWFYSKPYDTVDYDYANDLEYFIPENGK